MWDGKSIDNVGAMHASTDIDYEIDRIKKLHSLPEEEEYWERGVRVVLGPYHKDDGSVYSEMILEEKHEQIHKNA